MYCLIKHIWPYYILEHVVVSDWMAVACEHHRAKRKLQFEMSQQSTLCEYDVDDSGAHRATKRSYRTSHSLRRIWTTSARESMINVAVLYYFYRRRFLHMFSHLFLSKEFFESFRLQKKKWVSNISKFDMIFS